MKKKTLAVFATLIILMGSLLVGCAQGQTTAQGTTIGIIGAMDEEVATLKEAAKITKTTTIAQACYLNNTPFVVIRAISDSRTDRRAWSTRRSKLRRLRTAQKS